MKDYAPEKLVKTSRYKALFPTLPTDIQRDVLGRMGVLLEEEKRWCDAGNYKHIAQMFCHSDVINFGNLPYTDFKRTKTLCQGGDCCDFDFVRHDTDAGNGWERSESI